MLMRSNADAGECRARSAVQDHADSAVHTGLVAQNGKLELGVAAGMESCREVVFDDGVEKDLTGLGDAAADDDDIRIHNGRDVGEGGAQHLAESIDKSKGGCVAGFCRVEDRFAGDLLIVQKAGLFALLLKSEVGHADDTCGGGILLKAAFFAAAADSGLIFAHLHVADLACRAVAAGKDPAADDDAAYLQAMDFAEKFNYVLNEYQDEHGQNCNVDIYVVRPIIRIDETNPDEAKGELFYLFMNDIPWTSVN